MPAIDHYGFLSRLHATLDIQVYLETGVERGRTLSLAKHVGIGIDPKPIVSVPLCDNLKVFSQTSDDFFAENDVLRITNGQQIDLAFIDGLHTFEAALNDFINIERYSHAGTVVCVHDVVPHSAKMAQRIPQPDGWTGDVFGVIFALREHRPDLFTIVLDIAPTGMLVVTNLDSENTHLAQHFDSIVKQHMAFNYSKIHEARDEVLRVAEFTDIIIDFFKKNAELSAILRDWRAIERLLSSDPNVSFGFRNNVKTQENTK